MWEGAVVSIHIAKEAAPPMESVEEIRAAPGRGLEGDRYFHRIGTYSSKPGTGREVTLIEVETLEGKALEKVLGKSDNKKKEEVKQDVAADLQVGEVKPED